MVDMRGEISIWDLEKKKAQVVFSPPNSVGELVTDPAVTIWDHNLV
jgi:hypothetical protein